MRVKRLEIQGFKSFKDKTVIYFDHTITGIVGPNGCGKSNIVDAFFWVMGEQSYKHMRGSGSDDLIFNGSSKYSPSGLAEATLVLETDVPDLESGPTGASARDIPVQLRAQEVAVTRRVYRSGEGEYFINGVPARLKDIQELFMDTGGGAKGYSVIEQGQIGKIVTAKPEERRVIIEEAAGIAKYKARKKETFRKLEATNANLSRLNDVIQEIERNLGSLERQAQKARQYKKYKDELLDKEMTWGRRKSQVLRQKLESLRADRDAMEQEILALRAELQVAENSIELDRVEQLTDTKAAEDLQARIQELSSQLAREQSALELSRKRQGDLVSQLASLETEKNELETSIAEEREKLEARVHEASESDTVYAAASERAQSKDEEVRALREQAETARRELDQFKRELMAGISHASDLNSRAASLASRAESARAQAERLRSQLQAQNDKVQASREEAERAVESASGVKAKLAELQAARAEQGSKVQELELTLRARDRERDESGRKLTQLNSRLQSLEELAAAHEGFGDGPKAALDWAREKGAKSLRAMADAFDVQTGYEAALEGWLEGRIENLVSEDANLAIQALSHIQNQKQGRATIHVGGEQGPGGASFALVRGELEAAGFAVEGELAQFVSINGKLGGQGSAIAERAIAQVAIVSSFEPLATFIAQGGLERLQGWSIASREGLALDSSGTLRGGSIESDSAASLLGRKRVMTELTSQIETAEAAHVELERLAAESRQELEAARARLQGLHSEGQGLEVQLAAIERDVHQMSRAVRDAESQLELIQLEITEMEEEAQAALAGRTEIEAKIQAVAAGRSELETRIASAEAGLDERESRVRAEEAELQTLRVNEAQLRERASSIQRELQSGKALIADRERRLSEVVRVLERATRERDEHSGGDGELESRIQELTLTLASAREELALVKDRLEQSSAKLNTALERIKQLHATGDQKTAQSNQLALDIEKLSGELSHLVQNLEEKYGPGCLERPVTSPIQEEMSEPVVTQEMTAEEEQLLGEEVERLRERIRRLGEVNVMAIEEYEDLKKRYDHLLTEKNDLEQSIQNLQDAIEHINKTSEERFRRAFEAIANRFERLFPIIFGGGQAKLSLVYPEGSTDILEAGVDILAQPPGKKVVNIQLLSGGEKALTAVSLIFAIFMVKPSPFCVLDEVDAPLDDANIGKFNALLKEMSAKSQFILITHNKKTMELNDTLYGVTMEEPGVSKMVSIEMH